MNYPSGSASLFACIARQDPQETKCDWCGEKGNGMARYFGGFSIPTDHINCANNAQLASRDCSCLEHVGDNSHCPVHGGRHE